METNKRTKDKISDSSSTETDSMEQRKRSFHVTWDKALEIPNPLKTLQKWRLELSQNDFAALEYQLYISGCVRAKENGLYSYAARTIDIQNNDVYVKLIYYLDVWKAMHLLIWRYKNQTMR